MTMETMACEDVPRACRTDARIDNTVQKCPERRTGEIIGADRNSLIGQHKSNYTGGGNRLTGKAKKRRILAMTNFLSSVSNLTSFASPWRLPARAFFGKL
jgi:hypothetical protein